MDEKATSRIRATYDRQADRIYVHLGRGGREVVRTEGVLTDEQRFALDYGKDGALLGIEILGVSSLPEPE